jgi:hypothetical protein
MTTSEPGASVATYTFASGELRGTQLTLYPTSLVHRSANAVETIPLAALTAVSVAFRRNERRLVWGVGLIVLALLFLVIAGPLGRFASGAAGEMATAGGQGVAGVLLAFFRVLEALASALPVIALACVVGGAALGALGWMGGTLLLVSLPGSERVYSSRGRDTLLLDFAEALGQRLTLARR